jgi:hypothetical protein
VIVGAGFIITNKELHNAEHFTTWHGRLGVTVRKKHPHSLLPRSALSAHMLSTQTIAFLLLQALFGILVAYPSTQRLFGSVGRAKSLWRFHRFVVLLCALLPAQPN